MRTCGCCVGFWIAEIGDFLGQFGERTPQALMQQFRQVVDELEARKTGTNAS